MDGDASIPRDVANNVVGRHRVAAFGDAGHQVVHAADGDVCFGGAFGGWPENSLLGDFYLLGGQLFLYGDGDTARGDFVASNGG